MCIRDSNCTAHNTIPLMENVKDVFFPPNMTSVAQPMDQGVIKNCMHFYRRLVVQNILSVSYTHLDVYKRQLYILLL